METAFLIFCGSLCDKPKNLRGKNLIIVNFVSLEWLKGKGSPKF